MTGEELEKEAKEWCKSKNFTPSNVGYFASDYCEQSYIAGAELREKRIEELEKWLSEKSDECLKLQMLRADLVLQIGKQEKRIAELEAQIEKVKHYLDYDIPHDLINEATTKIWRMLK